MQFFPLQAKDNDAVLFMSTFATEIVKNYFDPLIGPAQNDYMIARFQSPEAIHTQLEKGYHYFFVTDNAHTPIGFLAYVIECDRLYLSKFYLHQTQRGKGYARTMLDFVINAAKNTSRTLIELNVYKHNDQARAVYEHFGFTIRRSEENDIGNGFIMDDYVYGLNLT